MYHKVEKHTSSKNIIEGAHKRAASNRHRTIFSLSPLYFDISEEAEQLKKVLELISATALANKVFPVPGGPKSNTPA